MSADDVCTLYCKTTYAYMRPYVRGEDLAHVTVSAHLDPESDMGMIASNPYNRKDQCYISRRHFEQKFKPFRLTKEGDT